MEITTEQAGDEITYIYSRGCAHGLAAQGEAWSKATPAPLRRTPLMQMMRALWGLPQPTQEMAKTSPRAAGPVAGARVLMMLAGWPPGVVHGGPETRHSLGNGCETRARSGRPPGEGGLGMHSDPRKLQAAKTTPNEGQSVPTRAGWGRGGVGHALGSN